MEISEKVDVFVEKVGKVDVFVEKVGKEVSGESGCFRRSV